MTKAYLLIAPALAACAAVAAHAAETSAKPVESRTIRQVDARLLLTSELTYYSEDFGKRQKTTASFNTDLGRTAFTVSASHARRKYEDGTYKAVELAGTMFHDWNDRLYTRTHVAIASDKPVFASRQVANDFNVKLLPNTVFTLGGKYARYHGNRDVLSWSAGGTWYFGGGLASYRFTAHDVDRLGNSHSHLASFRLKDGRGGGQTQLWLGSGTSLHEQEALLSGRKGSYRSIAVQRVQPIAGQMSANISLGRTWYDTSAADYRGTTASIGLNYNLSSRD